MDILLSTIGGLVIVLLIVVLVWSEVQHDIEMNKKQEHIKFLRRQMFRRGEK